MARSPTYLKQRRLGWYVQYPVPKHLWERVGSKTIERTLRTRDPIEAQRTRHAVIAAIQRELGIAEGRSVPRAAESLLELALETREIVTAGGPFAEAAELGFDASVDAFLEREGDKRGRDADGTPLLAPEDERLVRRAYKAVSGRLERTLRSQLDRYLEEQGTHITGSFVAEKRRWLESFICWAGEERDCAEVTRAELGNYVAEVIQKRTREGTAGKLLSVSSRQKEAGAIRGFFDWLVLRGVIADDPSIGMSRTIRGTKRGTGGARRPWTPKELQTVLEGIPRDDPAWSLTVLCAFSGMRREEVAQLRVADVERRMFRVREGKTPAAVRRVPIHPTIAPLVKRLSESSADGYLIPGLTETGRDRKRGTLVGKRFLNAIRVLGIVDPGLDLHAFRATVVTQLHPHMELSIIQRIIGHRLQGVTLSHYAGALPDKTLRDALARVSYGKRVAELIAVESKAVSITRKTRKRASAATR